MRILMIAHSRAPWTPHFARFFSRRGDAFKLVSFSPGPLDGVDGIDLAFVGIEPFDMHKNKHMFITRVPRVRRIIREFRPEVVFAPYLASNGLTAVLSWSGPLLISAVGGDVLEQAGRTGLRKWLRDRLVRFVAQRADLIHSVSQEIDDKLIALGILQSKIVQYPVGVDPDQFALNPDLPRRDGTRLVTIRKHEPIYDNVTIIRALEILARRGRKFHCTFACAGTLLEMHKAMVRQAGLEQHVTFTGDLPHAELPALLSQGDIYISASLSDGTSVSLLEAMSVGLFPVVSRIRANEPWIEHGRTGLLFDTGRPESLADCLERAMDDFEMRRVALPVNRNRVLQEGSMPRTMERIAIHLEQLAAEKSGTRA